MEYFIIVLHMKKQSNIYQRKIFQDLNEIFNLYTLSIYFILFYFITFDLLLYL